MTSRHRAIGALLALILSTALTGVATFTSGATALAAAAGPPPACATTDPNLECVHAPTPDITALPAPAFTTKYDIKHHLLTIAFVAAITPPYHQCPDGGVPGYYIPCSFRGLGVTGPDLRAGREGHRSPPAACPSATSLVTSAVPSR